MSDLLVQGRRARTYRSRGVSTLNVEQLREVERGQVVDGLVNRDGHVRSAVLNRVLRPLAFVLGAIVALVEEAVIAASARLLDGVRRRRRVWQAHARRGELHDDARAELGDAIAAGRASVAR